MLEAWREFLPGKRAKQDVQEYSRHLIDSIVSLHEELQNGTYRHGPYIHFRISDPKPRDIHKAQVRDRLVHHAIYRVLYPYFSRRFIADSFSCQIGKGTHRALKRFELFGRRVSKNNTCTCWVLKCDIRKFFASIDHEVLLGILQKHIKDDQTFVLLKGVIQSFSWTSNTGLPLGNLTSQLFVNVYMNEFDQFVKHRLKAKYYIRYADDFVFFSENRKWLENLISKIRDYLEQNLKLQLHPKKVSITTLASGIDFLGWVHFADHRVLRTASKKRMMKRISENPSDPTLQSYLGLLKHGNTRKIRSGVLNVYYFLSD